MSAPSDRRLWGAVTFSLVVVAALLFAAVMLPSPAPDDMSGLLLPGVTAALAVAAVFSVWVLLAALLGERPVWRHPVARWVWVWTLGYCLALGAAALTHRTNDSMSSVLLYACGLLALFSGAPGLLIAALPPRVRRDFYGRKM